MPTLSGRYSNTDPLPALPCVYCRVPTDVRVAVPGREDSHEVPLHILCAAMVIRLYNRLRSQGELDSKDRDALDRVETNVRALPALYGKDWS